MAETPTNNGALHTELEVCLSDATAIADLLMNTTGDAKPESVSWAGHLILTALERADEITTELR